MLADVQIVGGSYDARSRNIAALSCINQYPEYPPQQSKAVPALIGTPGVSAFSTLGSATAVRGLATDGTYLYAANLNKFYRITTAGTATAKGTLLTSTGQVNMVWGGTYLMIVDGTYGYTYIPSTDTFAQIVDADFPTPTSVCHIDGYYIVSKSGTGRFYNSALNNPASWSATEYATAESATDNLIAVADLRGELWLFGEFSTEVWYDAANANGSPFSKIPSAELDYGLSARQTVAKADHSLFWLGGTSQGEAVVLRSQGYAAKRVSHNALEYLISTYGDVSDAIGYTYFEDGHTFYVLIFPSAETYGRTWVYDLVTDEWHERRSEQATASETLQGRHISNCFVYFGNALRVGGFEDGKVHTMSLATYMEGSRYIRRVKRFAVPDNNQTQTRIYSLQVVFEPGVGLASGQGSDPQAMLRWSNDDGATWSPERWAGIGKIGVYKNRCKWNMLGSGRNRVFELVVTDPIKYVVTKAVANLSPGVA